MITQRRRAAEVFSEARDRGCVVGIGAHGAPTNLFSSLRLCVSACAISFAQNAENPRLSRRVRVLGAIRELREMYGGTVTVSRKFLNDADYRII